MERILNSFAYGPEPVADCYWGPTTLTGLTKLQGAQHTKIAIIGAGFTGLSAALHLAAEGKEVTVLEAETPGWGASARNGGFCCLGGAALGSSTICKRYGQDGLQHWRATEAAAIHLVRDLLTTYGIDAETHSKGETILAHTPRAMVHLRENQAEIETDYGFTTTLHELSELTDLGMRGNYYGALTLPHGFGLNPRKYVDGLAQAAMNAGARIYTQSPALSVSRQNGSYTLATPRGHLRADQVIFATNGYSAEDVPPWMRSRFLPLQSNVLVTRPLSDREIAQGWSSTQMAYTQATFLHYFRLMPNKQFLFGMRGGFFTGPRAFQSMQARTRRHFERTFPFWSHVETPHSWNGVLAFTPNLVPFVGAIPEMPGAFAGFAYHGNGVAMGTHAGAILARLAMGRDAGPHYPELMQDIPKRTPLGRYRRALMAPGYAVARLLGH